jgi:hypothetical protein
VLSALETGLTKSALLEANVAVTQHIILVVPAQNPDSLPQRDAPDVIRETAAAIVEGLISQSLANDDLLGRLYGSLVLARIRRAGQR